MKVEQADDDLCDDSLYFFETQRGVICLHPLFKTPLRFVISDEVQMRRIEQRVLQPDEVITLQCR